jgi:hypothetical protein
MRDIRRAYKISTGKSRRKRLLENLGVDGKITLKWIIQKLCVEQETEFDNEPIKS